MSLLNGFLAMLIVVFTFFLISCEEVVTPKDSVYIMIDTVHTNYKCIESELNFGELKAYLLNQDSIEIENYDLFTFQWYAGISLSSPLEGCDSTRLIGLAEGTYTLVVTNRAGATMQLSATIDATEEYPALTIVKYSDQTDGENPNGKLEVIIEGGSEGYTIQWEDACCPLEGMITSVADGLQAGIYYVVVTGPNGCSIYESAPVFDLVGG